MQEKQVFHEIAPVYDSTSKILILGSFPSVKSRETGFFYGHPQNRFWRVLAELLKVEMPTTIDEKRTFLLEHHIAVWDVIASCKIIGSSDSSIRDAIPNDLGKLLNESQIQRIYTNGGTAWKLYQKYTKEKTGMEAVKLPSTSPANASYRFDDLVEAWNIII